MDVSGLRSSCPPRPLPAKRRRRAITITAAMGVTRIRKPPPRMAQPNGVGLKVKEDWGGDGVSAGVGAGVAAGVGEGVGPGVGPGVGAGVGAGVGEGVGA